jgi:hypothetical protein
VLKAVGRSEHNRRIITVGTEETAPRAEQLTQQPPQREPETWGTPLPPGAQQVDVPTQVEMRPHWSAKKLIGVVVLAVIVVGGGTAVAIAATQTTTVTDAHPSAGVSGGDQVTGGAGASHRNTYPGGYAGPLTNAVHGEFVVRTSTGAYATERFQTGTVTKVSTATLTLSSADHYVGTYLLNSSTVVNRGAATISDVQVGDNVTVIATLSGSSATAATVTDTADKQRPTPHPGAGTGGMQPNDTTSANPGN